MHTPEIQARGCMNNLQTRPIRLVNSIFSPLHFFARAPLSKVLRVTSAIYCDWRAIVRNQINPAAHQGTLGTAKTEHLPNHLDRQTVYQPQRPPRCEKPIYEEYKTVTGTVGMAPGAIIAIAVKVELTNSDFRKHRSGNP